MGARADHPPYMPGHTVQIVNFQTGAVNTGSTLILCDDTIPQKTEGDEYMTLSITPRNVNNKLKIEVTAVSSSSGADRITVALFQDNIGNALAAAFGFPGASLCPATISFVHYMVAGTILETTFKVRIGLSTTGILTFNGDDGARRFGGVMASSITITEFKA